MSITTYDHNLGFPRMVLWALDLDPLNNRNPFEAHTDPEPAPVNAINTAAQSTEVVRFYKDNKEKLTTYCGFRIILISMITNKCPENHMTTLKHCITKFRQCKPLTILAHLYTGYGTITSSDLTANFYSMNAGLNTTTPIAGIFQQINYIKELSE